MRDLGELDYIYVYNLRSPCIVAGEDLLGSSRKTMEDYTEMKDLGKLIATIHKLLPALFRGALITEDGTR